MMPGLRTRILPMALLMMAALSAAPALADDQLRFGVRGGVYADPTDPFVGVELLYPLRGQWYFNPNVEAVFGDRTDLMVVSLDVHYDLFETSTGYFWLGGGLAAVIKDPDQGDRETDAGIDLLVGGALKTSSGVLPYLQGKILVSDDSRAVFAVGVRF